MINLRMTGLRVAAIVVLHTLWVSPSHSEAPAGSVPGDETSKQSGIYQSRGANVPEGYVVDRSLLSYTFTLPAGFNRALAKLGPKDRWLDIGAGEGRAILDYCTSKYDAMHLKEPERSGRKGKAVAISIEDRRTAHWHQTAAGLEPDQIQYFFGKPLREYSSEELGQFQVITDVMGGFSYARHLSLFMEKALGLLALNGSFYTLLQDVRSEQGTNRPYYPGASFLTEIAGADGSEVSVCAWLKRITCVEVACELKAEWSPPIEVYRIRKTCNDVSVPGLLPTHFAAGTPPERRFKFGAPSAAASEESRTTR